VLEKLLSLFVLVLVLGPAYGEEAKPVEADVALENRVMAVAGELRCLVCQNQTIADSHADLAKDLRNQVREMLRQGKSKDEIVDYMVKRYGDFVLYRPRVKSSTLLLWFGPLVLLVLAFVVLMFKLRQRRQAMQQEVPLSFAEHEQVASLLSETDKGI
jgi:cytochrome c-type biogenesis protein CcmH